jgi:hypothetical protein
MLGRDKISFVNCSIDRMAPRRTLIPVCILAPIQLFTSTDCFAALPGDDDRQSAVCAKCDGRFNSADSGDCPLYSHLRIERY